MPTAMWGLLAEPSARAWPGRVGLRLSAGRWAVRFHPESILTAAGGTGHQVIANVLRLFRAYRCGRRR